MHSWKEPFAPTLTAAMIAATTAFGVVAILLMFAMGALLKSPGVMFAALLVAGLAYLSQMLTTHGELLRTLGASEDTAHGRRLRHGRAARLAGDLANGRPVPHDADLLRMTTPEAIASGVESISTAIVLISLMWFILR